MGMKTFDLTSSKHELLPGPGQYDISSDLDYKLKRDPSFSIGTSKRADAMRSIEALPGPGQYSTLDNSHFIKKSAPKFGFGTSKRDEHSESKMLKNVGPGAYDINTTIGNEGTKVSISPKFNDKQLERESRNIPGPGAYDVLSASSTLQSQPAYKIGTSKRYDSLPRNSLPGPD